MKITNDNRIISGEHNKQAFELSNGFLIMFGRAWSKSEIRTLIETANLLNHTHGHAIIGEKPKQKNKEGLHFRWIDMNDAIEPNEEE